MNTKVARSTVSQSATELIGWFIFKKRTTLTRRLPLKNKSRAFRDQKRSRRSKQRTRRGKTCVLSPSQLQSRKPGFFAAAALNDTRKGHQNRDTRASTSQC